MALDGPRRYAQGTQRIGGHVKEWGGELVRGGGGGGGGEKENIISS